MVVWLSAFQLWQFLTTRSKGHDCSSRQMLGEINASRRGTPSKLEQLILLHEKVGMIWLWERSRRLCSAYFNPPCRTFKSFSTSSVDNRMNSFQWVGSMVCWHLKCSSQHSDGLSLLNTALTVKPLFQDKNILLDRRDRNKMRHLQHIALLTGTACSCSRLWSKHPL